MKHFPEPQISVEDVQHDKIDIPDIFTLAEEAINCFKEVQPRVVSAHESNDIATHGMTNRYIAHLPREIQKSAMGRAAMLLVRAALERIDPHCCEVTCLSRIPGGSDFSMLEIDSKFNAFPADEILRELRQTIKPALQNSLRQERRNTVFRPNPALGKNFNTTDFLYFLIGGPPDALEPFTFYRMPKGAVYKDPEGKNFSGEVPKYIYDAYVQRLFKEDHGQEAEHLQAFPQVAYTIITSDLKELVATALGLLSPSRGSVH